MKKPLISYGWLRPIIFLLIYVGVAEIAMLLFWGIWALLQGGAPVGLGQFKQTTSKLIWLQLLLNIIAAFSSVWLCRKFIDRQSFVSLGFEWKGFETYAFTGFFGGIGMLGVGTMFLVLLKYLSFTDIDFNGLALLNGAVMMLMVAFYEELIFRGYFLNNFMQSMNKWVALFVTAVIFASAHLLNPGMGIISFLEIFVAGVMLGVNYIYTKNLWFGILLHFSWNFFQGPIFGYGVSGLNLPSVLHQSLNGPIAITGGTFGFEGSVLSAVLNLIFIGLLVMVYEKGTTTIKTDVLKTA